VPEPLIALHGAVSAEVACAMAEGALARSKAQVSVAVTGVAGPGGGSVTKPVGTVWMAVGRLGAATVVELLQLAGDRAAVRSQTLSHALNAVINAANAT
jgi:nicotinamide-nucleotide amidase